MIPPNNYYKGDFYRSSALVISLTTHALLYSLSLLLITLSAVFTGFALSKLLPLSVIVIISGIIFYSLFIPFFLMGPTHISKYAKVSHTKFIGLIGRFHRNQFLRLLSNLAIPPEFTTEVELARKFIQQESLPYSITQKHNRCYYMETFINTRILLYCLGSETGSRRTLKNLQSLSSEFIYEQTFQTSERFITFLHNRKVLIGCLYPLMLDTIATNESASKESIARKNRSIEILENLNIPTLAHLPVLEDTTIARLRSKEVILGRIIALTIISARISGLSLADVQIYIKMHSTHIAFSPLEQDFVYSNIANEADASEFSCSYLSIWPLLWALQLVPTSLTSAPPAPKTKFDYSKVFSLITSTSSAELLVNSNLRNLPEILDAADLAYRYHWAAVNEQLTLNANEPPTLPYAVTSAHLKAFNWLISDVDWDSVTTDT
jgi:hypothetical protein